MANESISDADFAHIQRTEALLAAIVASSDDAIISKGLDGIIDSWNKGAERLFGYTAAEAIGRPILMIIPPGREDEERIILQRLRAGQRVDHFETIRHAKDGRPVDVSVTVSPISDRTGRIIGASKVARDISERKRIERARESFNQELERLVAERTREADLRTRQLRRLARDLTGAEQRERQRMAQLLHDGLAQILAVAKMQVGMLAQSGPQGVKHLSDYLDQAIRYTRGMMNDLSPKVLEDRGMAAALIWLAGEFEQRYALSVDVSDVTEQWKLSPESSLLLFNGARELLMNVVKHADNQRAAVSFHSDSTRARIVVRDWGKGFDPKQKPSSASLAGGFGLSSLQERLDVLDGSLTIDATPGQGAAITLELPVTAGAGNGAPSGLEEQRQHQPKAPSPISVLLVDDHPVLRDGLRRIFDFHDDIVVVGEAADGQEAIHLATTLAPDVVLMDISMPRLNGLDATKALRQSQPQTQVIILTNYDDADTAASARAAGAFAFLTKGGSTPQLISVIHTAFDAQTSAIINRTASANPAVV